MMYETEQLLKRWLDQTSLDSDFTALRNFITALAKEIDDIRSIAENAHDLSSNNELDITDLIRRTK